MRKILLLFMLVPLALKAQNDCEALTRKVDKFNGRVTINTPLLEKVAYWKEYVKGVPKYSLTLTAYGSTLNYHARGAVILLEGGKRITKPTLPIDVDTGSDAWEYTAYIKLTPADITLLKAHKITDFRLYIYDETLDDIERDRAIDWFNCLLITK